MGVPVWLFATEGGHFGLGTGTIPWFERVDIFNHGGRFNELAPAISRMAEELAHLSQDPGYRVTPEARANEPVCHQYGDISLDEVNALFYPQHTASKEINSGISPNSFSSSGISLSLAIQGMEETAETLTPSAAPEERSLQLLESRYGYMLFDEVDPIVGTSLSAYGEYADAAVKLFAHCLKADDWALDVGANVGAHTLPIRAAVGDSGRVYAFEEDRLKFQLLNSNTSLNAYDNIYTFQEESQTLAIDALDLPRCDFIRLARQGEELDVLLGARFMLSKFKPFIYIENPLEDELEKLERFLASYGYRPLMQKIPLFNANNAFNNETDLFPDLYLLGLIAYPAV